MSEPLCWVAHRCRPPFPAVPWDRQTGASIAQGCAFQDGFPRAAVPALALCHHSLHLASLLASDALPPCTARRPQLFWILPSLPEPASLAARYTIFSLNFNSTPPFTHPRQTRLLLLLAGRRRGRRASALLSRAGHPGRSCPCSKSGRRCTSLLHSSFPCSHPHQLTRPQPARCVTLHPHPARPASRSHAHSHPTRWQRSKRKRLHSGC